MEQRIHDANVGEVKIADDVVAIIAGIAATEVEGVASMAGNITKEIISKLSNGETLDPKYKDHPLAGNWIGHRECHLQPDWLLIYRYDDDILVLTLTRTGSHSDLFSL